MPLKLTCPNCGRPTRVDEPYPLPGAEVQCTTCATGMAVSYPPGVMQKLRDRGKRFAGDPPAPDRATPPLPDRTASPAPPPPPSPRRRQADAVTPSGAPTAVDPTHVDAATPRYETERTVSSGRDPWGRLPGGAPEADAEPATSATEPDAGPTPREVRPPVGGDGRVRRPAAPPSMPAFSVGAPALPEAESTVDGAGRVPEADAPPADLHERTTQVRDPSPAATDAYPTARFARPSKPDVPGSSAHPTARFGRGTARDAFDDAPTAPDGRSRRPAPAPSVPAFTTASDGPTPPPPPSRRERPAPRVPSPEPARSASPPSRSGSDGGSPPPPRKRSALGRWTRRLGCLAVVALLLVGLGGAGSIAGVYAYYGQDLPSVDALQTYRPPTVTEVYGRNGELIGELYEQRRYVVPLEDIPDHVRHAFIAAEDAKFYDHGGVDYIGLVRAVINEVTGGAKRQGASTITMQVTRNFLLTRDKTYERKIKEIILAQRIESVYDKDRILWLYLNEIYLGSGAYGAEAAARVYFGKHVDELSIAEAALVAGLAPAPSNYSPHRSWDKARTRQEYVLGNMLRHGFITQEQHDAALAEDIPIVKEENPFLTMAPHYTEYVRRHIIEEYGFERVYNDGLIVHTTMDLDLQRTAQEAVVRQVHAVDQRMGFRRAGLETLASDDAIEARRAEHEAAMKERNAFEADPAGRVPVPDRSQLVPGRVYDAVVLQAEPRWVKVGIGAHEAIIPLAWSEWVYEPNPRMSWRRRRATDLTATVRGWEEGVDKGGTLLRRGDVVLVKVQADSTTEPTALAPDEPDPGKAGLAQGDDEGDGTAEIETITPEAVRKAFRGTPGEETSYVAARLWQTPEVEAATMTFDLETGAVHAMVGGADFATSEFNRAIQARRQVGSTFKPIVYAAAVDTERLTAASMVPDVRGASYTTDAGFVWKPDNYGDEYLGNITLRRALALSKNTCTIKVLESMDPGMNDDVLYSFARKLGIGGPPEHSLPEGHVPKPDNDHLCPWVRETPESTICMDRFPPKDPDISNTRHRQLMGPDDVHMCRACDMSMGLGSASLTMEELLRAYSAFGTGGHLVQPYYIERIEDRDGNVLEQHEPREFPQVIRPEVATIATWLLENVVNYGTGAAARRALGVTLAGKTGTTQDYKDTWFVGFSPDVITGAWVGYDEPRTLGVSSTGGRTALPIWIDVMRQAAPKEADRRFPTHGDIEWAQIDEDKGTRVTSGGRNYPFIKDTVPASTGVAAGELTVDDFTEL